MKNILLDIVLFLVLVLGIGFFWSHDVSITDDYTIKEDTILIEHEHHYLLLDEHKVSISEELLNDIELNQSYTIHYNWNDVVKSGFVEKLTIEEGKEV